MSRLTSSLRPLLASAVLASIAIPPAYVTASTLGTGVREELKRIIIASLPTHQGSYRLP